MPKKTASKKPARSAHRPSISTAKIPAAKLAKPAKTPAPAPEKKAPVAAKPAPATKAPVRTMVGAAVELIKAGKTNAEVREMLVRDFALPPAHAFYASWYRSYAIRKGLVTHEFARAHAGEAAPRASAPGAAK